MKLKFFFRLFLLVFISLAILIFPKKTYAQNKCGVNIADKFSEVSEVANLTGQGGWVVYSTSIDKNILEQVFGQGLNIVIRGHAHWLYQLPEDQQKLDEYALSWVATMASLDTKNQPIFFMPVNEPNQSGFSDGLSASNTTHYIQKLQDYIRDFKSAGLIDDKIKLLSPMLNQTHPNFSTYLGSLGGMGFYNQFEGSSQNLYDRQGCTNWPFCDPDPVWNGSKYSQVISVSPHYAIEAGVSGGSGGVRYQDQDIAQIVEKGLTSAWTNSNFKMMAIFSYDPEGEENWNIFTAPLTRQAYQSNCQASSPETGSYKATDPNDIIAKYPQLVKCDNGGLATDEMFCAGGGGDNLVLKDYKASRYVDPGGQTSKSLTDPVWFDQDDALAEYETEKDGLWGADFSNFNGLTIPWAQEIVKFLAGPFVYQGNTAIRRTLDQGDLTQYRPLTDLTPRETQDQLRLKYWEGCNIDNDICHPDLLCHKAVIDKSYECHENEGLMTPCVGETSNECLLSNGKEIASAIAKPPVGSDGRIDYWSAEYKVWHDKYSSLWVEVPLFSNPITKTKKAITIATCDYESSSGTTETYTPWVASLKEVSTFLNTMLSPSKSKTIPKEGIIPITNPGDDVGAGTWYINENSQLCLGEGSESDHILGQNPAASFIYQATVKLESSNGKFGLSFRQFYDNQADLENINREYAAYQFAIGSNKWWLHKSQTPLHNLSPKKSNRLNNLKEPMTLIRGDLDSELSDNSEYVLKIKVENISENEVLIHLIVKDEIGNSLLDFEYTDAIHPLTGKGDKNTGGTGFGFMSYHSSPCFYNVSFTPLQISKQLKQEPFFSQAYQLVKNDYANFKNRVNNFKNKAVLPLKTVKQSWQENEDLSRYQKIEKVLLTSKELFQPGNNLLAQSSFSSNCANIDISFKQVENNQAQYTICYTQTNPDITGCLGDPFVRGPGGSFIYTDVNGAGCLPPLPDKACINSGDTIAFPHINLSADGSFFVWADIWGDGWVNTCGNNTCCTNGKQGEYYVGCQGKYNKNYNTLAEWDCSPSNSPPNQPIPRNDPDVCLPPDTPEYKENGPEDPVIAEGHLIFNPGSYHLKGEWTDIVNNNGVVIGVKCKGKCGAEYKEPVWAKVRYPFLQQSYDQLSNLKNGLFAKFLPYVAPEYQPDDWDVAGESQINYCIKQMKDLGGAHPNDPGWQELTNKFPDNAKLYSYPSGKDFTKNAVCSGETRDLKAYPKYIGGIANAWQWLVCTLNPADAYCEYFYDFPDQQIYPTPKPGQDLCLPWSHFCANVEVKFRDKNDQMSINQQDLINYVTDGSHWPESNINTKIDDEFIANAKSVWEDAIIYAQAEGLPVLTQLQGFAANIDIFKDKTWLEFVIAAAERHNWSPRFVTTLWIEESGASAYDHWSYPVEDLGCGGHDENLAKNLTCLFTNFDTDRFQSSDWEQFLLTYASSAEASKGCFQEHPNFPKAICHFYHFLIDKEPPEIPEPPDITTDIILVGDSSYLWGNNYIAQAVRTSFENKAGCDIDKIIAPDSNTYKHAANNRYKIWDPNNNDLIIWTMKEVKESTDNGHQAVVLIGFGANESKDIAGNKKNREEFNNALDTVIQKARNANALVVLATPLKGCPGPGASGRSYFPERDLKDMASNIRAIALQNGVPIANNYQAFDSYQCPSSEQGWYPSSGCGDPNTYYQCLDDKTPELCCPSECLINVGPYRSEGFDKRQCSDDYAHPNKTGFELMGNTISDAIESLGVCQ